MRGSVILKLSEGGVCMRRTYAQPGDGGCARGGICITEDSGYPGTHSFIYGCVLCSRKCKLMECVWRGIRGTGMEGMV